MARPSKKTRFPELKRVFDRLLAPNGCPWDRQQTHRSLVKYLREEVGEFVQALRSGDDDAVCEELGDILLQVMFHAQIAKREGRFDVEDVIGCLVRKLKRRHPHVFGNKRFRTAEAVVTSWRRIKKREKKHRLNVRKPRREPRRA